MASFCCCAASQQSPLFIPRCDVNIAAPQLIGYVGNQDSHPFSRIALSRCRNSPLHVCRGDRKYVSTFSNQLIYPNGQAGYILHDRVIRPAEVVVTVAINNEEAEIGSQP